MGDETHSGHWLYAFLRRDGKSGQAFLVVANFHPSEPLRGVKIRIPHDARMFIGRTGDARWSFTDRLDSTWTGTLEQQELEASGLPLPDLAPLSAMLLEIVPGR